MPYEEVKTVEVQAAEIEAKARNIDGAFVRCRKELELVAKDPWPERPEFHMLLRQLCRGDHLIVWRLDRIDHNPIRLIRAVEVLVKRGVCLHSLEERRGVQLDLSTAGGEGLLFAWNILADLLVNQRKETARRAMQWRKDNSFAYCAYPPLGKRRVRGKLHGKVLKVDAWYEPECQQIREIKRRHDAGETLVSIGKDFYKRQEKTASGKPWVSAYGRKKRLKLSRIYKAYRFYSDLLARGEGLSGIPAILPPPRKGKK